MRITGVVVHGDGVGRQLGYPTANITMSSALIYGDGIYAAWVYLGEKIFPAALVISKQGKKVEAHLLDYAGDSFYGENIAIDVVRQAGDHTPMAYGDELKQKIAKDIEQVKNILYEQRH